MHSLPPGILESSKSFYQKPRKTLRTLQAPCTSPRAPAQLWTEQCHIWTHGTQDLENRAFNSPLPHIKITEGWPDHLASRLFTYIHPFTCSCCYCYLPQKAEVRLRSHSLSFPSPITTVQWSHSTHKTCSLDTAEVGSTVLREQREWYYTGVLLQMHSYLQHQSTILRPATFWIPKNWMLLDTSTLLHQQVLLQKAKWPGGSYCGIFFLAAFLSKAYIQFHCSL